MFSQACEVSNAHEVHIDTDYLVVVCETLIEVMINTEFKQPYVLFLLWDCVGHYAPQS